MGKMSTVEARNKFSELLNKTAYGKERMILTRRGKDLVAVVPMKDLEALEELERRMDLEEALEALKEEGSVSWEKIKKELDL